MRLGIASWSFLLITLVFLVAKDGNPRKMVVKSEMDNQLMKPLNHDSKQSPTKDLVVNDIMEVEGSDNLKLNMSSDENEEEEEEDNHPKHKEKADEDSNEDSDDEDSDDEDDDVDDHDHEEEEEEEEENKAGVDHKKKGKEDSEKGHKDEHKMLIKDHVEENDIKADDHDDGDDHKKKGKKDHKKEHKDEHKMLIKDHIEENEIKVDDHDNDGGDHKKKGKKDHKKEHKDEHKKLIMNPLLDVFFTPNDLQVGKTISAYFANKNSSTSPKFLAREEAEQIPFSSKMLSSILKVFSIPKHSRQAKHMKRTLKICEFEAIEEEIETKFCATSLESVLDSARHVFGSDAQLKFLTTTHITNPTALLQNYTIREVKEISVAKVLGCHQMPYPYAVFYCQSQRNDTNLYDVLVEGDNGAKVQAAAVCHVDTSKWDSHHVSFRMLNLAPGTSPVCHFLSSGDLVLVLSPVATPSP